MAKGSQFWGNASGKLGEQVLYRAGGEQRARTYVAKIKNPRTFAQMKNRLLMLNVVSMYRTLKPLLSETFPMKKSNQSAFNAFVSANKTARGFYITKSDMESGACVPYGMQISAGSIGVSLQPTMRAINDVRDKDASPKYGWAVDGLLDLSGFKLTMPRNEADRVAGDGVLWLTPAELSSVMKECCVVSLPSQYQLSIIHAEYADEDADMSQDIWQPSFTVYHCQANNAYQRTYGIRPKEDLTRIGIHASKKTDHEDESITYEFDYVVIGDPALSQDWCATQCVGLVLSYKDKAGTQVSTSKMCVVPAKFDGRKVEDPSLDFVEGGYYFEQVMEEYGYKSEGVLTSVASDAPAVEEEEEEEDFGGV